MNKLLFFLLCLAFVFVSANSVQAQSSQSAGLRPSKMVDRPEKKAENNLERLKNKTNKEIERRLKSLNNLINVINRFKKISAEQKTSLVSQVQAQIDALTALQVQLTGATDIESIRAVKQSLVEDYRIFALFIPKIHIMANADRLLMIAEKANTLADNLEERIDEEQAKGTDVSAMQSLLISMRSRLVQAETQAQSALSTVTPLTPEGFPANRLDLRRAREMLRLAHQQLVLGRLDGRRIMQALGIGANATSAPSVTAQPTPTP